MAAAWIVGVLVWNYNNVLLDEETEILRGDISWSYALIKMQNQGWRADSAAKSIVLSLQSAWVRIPLPTSINLRLPVTQAPGT